MYVFVYMSERVTGGGNDGVRSGPPDGDPPNAGGGISGGGGDGSGVKESRATVGGNRSDPRAEQWAVRTVQNGPAPANLKPAKPK